MTNSVQITKTVKKIASTIVKILGRHNQVNKKMTKKKKRNMFQKLPLRQKDF